MSRRKQSNPKPLKPGEDTEWTANEKIDGGDATVEKMLVKTEQEPSPPPRPSTAEPDEPAPAVDQPLKLRLNPNLAMDPARWSPANEPPPPLPPPATVITAAVASSSSNAVEQNHNVVTITTPRAVQTFICIPCGIRFSSLSTLDAHQTYYCARRNKKDSESDDAKVPIVVESEEMAMANDTDSRPSSVEPSAKSARTGKQYKCPHCSYSADKKVSLNRHMRMHSISPVSVQSPPCPPESAVIDPSVVDRYCQNCDIRFSNLRTYQAHKTHYCNTRHVVKPTPSSSPMPTNPSPTNVPTYLALPTNPVILVPYTLVQNASVLSALSTEAGPPPPTDTACIVLSDGTLQPIAQALVPTKFNDNIQRENSESPPEVAFSPPKKVEVIDQDVKRPIVGPSSPLDLRLKRVVKSSQDGEEEKENRRSDGNITDTESIVCAPSIPFMILSPSSSPSISPPQPLPPGVKFSQQHRSAQHHQQHHLHHQPINGMIQKPQTPVVEMFDNSERNGKFSVSSLIHANKLENVKNEPATAAAMNNNADGLRHHHHRNHHQLPSVVQRYNPMMQHNNNNNNNNNTNHNNNNNNNNNNNKSRNIIVAPSLQPPPVVQRNDLLNAAVLPYFTPEMTMRLAAANPAAVVAAAAAAAAAAAVEQRPGIPPSAHQFFLKQGPSKCESCNIVFCKYENFLAHKKHYCASRPPPPAVDVAEDADKTSPEGSPGPLAAKQPLTVASPQSSKDSSSPTPAATLKPPMIQFMCHTCGIKFSSFDNLTAHQSIYCPYRPDPAAAAADKSSSSSSSPSPHHGAAVKCPKCKMIVDGTLHHHQCSAAVNCWKCPVCSAICPSASAAQKHLDNHNGIKAFVCTICQYKGNTLRGLRTHIRMHFNKQSIPVLMEEDYVTCVIDESSASPMTDGAVAKTPLFDADKPPAANSKISAAETARSPDKVEPTDFVANIKQERPSSNGTVVVGPDAADQPAVVGAIKRPMTTKYCKACDISFNYLSTFIAHKKYYCRNSAEYRCNAENAAKKSAATGV